jgi:hypothetical protein
MSALGYLFGDDYHDTVFCTVFESLADSKRAGVDFHTAWAVAMRACSGLPGPRAGEQSVHDFARIRFERAYYGLDPSVRVCQAAESCTSPAVVHGVACDIHADRRRVGDLITERQEAIAA